MGILDDAIREHLDLKRSHGARETELREIEDEAFGQGDQPDAFVAGELYTEGGTSEGADAGNEEPTRLVEPETLRPTEPASEPEALRPAEPEPELEPEPETSDQPVGLEPPSQVPGQVELPGQDEIPGQERLEAEPDLPSSADEPESYRPAEETSEPPEAPATSESLEELIAEEEPFPEDTAAPPPAPIEAEPASESRPLEPEPDAQAPPESESLVPDPPPPPPEPGTEPPGRARGRVDVPTQEHPPPGDTGDLPPLPGDEPELGRPDTTYEPPPVELPEDEAPSEEEPLPDEDTSSSSDGPQLYDFETDEDPVPSSGGTAVEDDFEALGPAEDEAPYLEDEEPYTEEGETYPEEPASGVDSGGEEPHEEAGTEVRPVADDEESGERGSLDTVERSKEDEEEDEEEDLWFEKGPPKDFDFDD
jgi:hypothetical protein